MSKLNLQRLSHFLAVVDAGSLGRAAPKIGISQPAVTKSVRKLEEEIGFSLFDRAGSLELTTLGREFVVRARALVRQAGDVEREMELLSGGETGNLKVVCGPTMAETLMPPALARLISRNPRLQIEARVDDFRVLPDLLRERKVDLGVGECTALQQESDLEIISLPPQEVVFVCRAGHPLAEQKRRRVKPAEFFAYPVVTADLPDWAVAWLRENNPNRTDGEGITLTSSHYSLLKGIISRSDAVTGLPEGAVSSELEAGELVRIRLDAPKLVNRAGIVHLRDRTLSPSAQLLIECLTS